MNNELPAKTAREGRPSPRFGHRGLHTVELGGGSKPLLLRLYGQDNELLARLTEERGDCIDEGYVDFFLGPNCRPALYKHYLVEKLADGTTGVLHDNPKAIAADFPKWVAFLDAWVTRHENIEVPKQLLNAHPDARLGDGPEARQVAIDSPK